MSANKNFFRASAEDFKKIPGSPVAYWVSERMNRIFQKDCVGNHFHVKAGICTGDNAKFIFQWWEVCFGESNVQKSEYSYTAHNKGGGFRRWYGNRECFLKYSPKSLLQMEKCPGFRHDGKEFYFRDHIGWSKITSSLSSFRLYEDMFTFDSAGLGLFPRDKDSLLSALGLLNSKVVVKLIEILNPTLNVTPVVVKQFPHLQENGNFDLGIKSCINLSKIDWNSYETSWDFSVNPLVAELNNPVNLVNPVKESEMVRSISGASDKSAFQLSSLYAAVRARWAKNCEEMRRLETENNRIFIEAYGLQDELTPEVPWHEITLTCNPWYRYGVKEVEKVAGGGDSFPLNPELEARLKADTVKELISYAVGCMMGRYAIDKPGLILADQGSTYGDYLAKVSEPEFDPDEDGIIPVIDEDCFADDIVIQFHKFLRTAFGAANFNANLSFIEEAIGKDLRSYFTKDFYGDHLQRYQKRPIYWLFSSPKGTFSALVYLHRYHPGTVGQVLTYLRSHITNLKSRLDAADRTTADPSATQGMKTKAIKERTKLIRQLKELEDYERDVLHPLASERLEIDLDDGVKVNYPKFGKALRKIPGFE